jgi:hypothetical protein
MKFEAAKSAGRELCIQGIILAIAATAVAVWILTKPIVFTHDTFTYIEHARELQLGRPSANMFSRLPIFPAILLAFQLTDLKHPVFWLIIFHSILAVASCWLFYLAARRLEPRGAFPIALVFIASLLPFVEVKYIMTEQVFFFETMLTLYGMVAYLTARTNPEALLSISILGAGAALMTLTRPQGAYVIPVLFGIVTALAWRRARIAVLCAAFVIGVVWSIQVVDQRLRSSSQTAVGSLDNSYMTGKMLFFTFYSEGYSANIRMSPENGPRMNELRAILVDELAKPDTLARRVGYLSSVTPEEVPGYVDRSFSAFDSNFFSMLAYTALNERLGLKEADRLLLRVSLEAALAHPVRTAWWFIDKGLTVYLNPMDFAVPLYGQFPSGTFQSQLADEIAAAGDYSNPTSTDRVIDRNLRWLMRGVIVVAIITLPMAIRYPTWRVTIALLLFGLYLNFAIIFANTAFFRYTIYAVPANLLCAYIGTVALVSALRDRWLKKPIVVNS